MKVGAGDTAVQGDMLLPANAADNRAAEGRSGGMNSCASLEMTMETNHYKTTAYAIRIGDEWFAGFGGKPGQESLTKVRPGLCDAKLVWDDRKAAAYVERLRVRGYMGEVVKVTA